MSADEARRLNQHAESLLGTEAPRRADDAGRWMREKLGQLCAGSRICSGEPVRKNRVMNDAHTLRRNTRLAHLDGLGGRDADNPIEPAKDAAIDGVIKPNAPVLSGPTS